MATNTPSPLEEISEVSQRVGMLENPYLQALAIFCVTLIFVAMVYGALRIIRRRRTNTIEVMLRSATRPVLAWIFLIGLELAVESIITDKGVEKAFNHGFTVAAIGVGGWLAIAMVRGFKKVLTGRYTLDVEDNYRARKMFTQFNVLSKAVYFIICLVTLALILLTFDGVAGLGTSLLASAGVTGIVFGFAAQRTLGALMAGIQIALTQPIRLEDAVVVENEWGWIEEINFTYVVIRIWDLRRLIVPTNYFIEKPFQNWTRQTAEIIGSIFIYTDYRLPVVELRTEFERSLAESKLWNGRVANLQVSDFTAQTMQIRCLMTAKDSPTTWDLRCEMREKLIDWIQRNHPDCLPQTRVQLESDADPQNVGSDRSALSTAFEV